MKCAIVTPVGPGHEYLAEDSADSAREAFALDAGPFDALEIVQIDDTAGAKGRSAARNEGVRAALAAGADWLFFLDADDLMHPRAFASARPYLATRAAIWGQICELAEDETSGVVRPAQPERIETLVDLLSHAPWLTLQMGHFARADVARANPFDESMDCGEDFDYYLRVWSKQACVKIDVPLFYNRRGMHSEGPRSKTGREWLRAVNMLIGSKCAELGIKPPAAAPRDPSHRG
jgi:glycosyltransferase involved in cell wall biosynthesis